MTGGVNGRVVLRVRTYLLDEMLDRSGTSSRFNGSSSRMDIPCRWCHRCARNIEVTRDWCRQVKSFSSRVGGAQQVYQIGSALGQIKVARPVGAGRRRGDRSARWNVEARRMSPEPHTLGQQFGEIRAVLAGDGDAGSSSPLSVTQPSLARRCHSRCG